MRIALGLPVTLTPEIRAATQVVAFLVQVVGRTEIDLLWEPRPVAGGLAGRRRVLLVAVSRNVEPDDVVARGRWERLVRAWVERQYARQGIAPVEYDLQVL